MGRLMWRSARTYLVQIARLKGEARAKNQLVNQIGGRIKELEQQMRKLGVDVSRVEGRGNGRSMMDDGDGSGWP